MSDISIPGISGNSGMNTSRMIDDLMEVERRPVRRMETRVETYESQQNAWRSMGRALGRLRDTSRTMYGFENPFRDRLADVSNPSVLTANASRQAREGIEELTVLQTAGSDRFASAPLDRDYRVPAGQYEFSVGDDTRSLRFGGGSLQDFVDDVNRRAEDVVRLSLVPDTPQTRVLIIEGQEEGAEATLSFGGAAAALMEETGVMAPARPDRRVNLLEGDGLRLAPGQDEDLPLGRRFVVDPGMVLRFEARTIDIPRQPWTPPKTPPGPDLPEAGGVTIQDITIQNEQLGFDLPEPPPAEPPERVDDNRALTMLGPGGAESLLPALPEAESYQSVEIPASQLMSSITGFSLTNRNTDRALEIRNLEILDPNQRGGGSPRNALDTARDARIRYNGIEITRSTNDIDDLIPGVTVTLRRPSDEPVEIDVQPDRETAKDAIIEMVGFYNQVIRDINIYTRNEQGLIDQIEYFDEAERETMQERLGIFQGDSALNQLRSRMQTIMMNAYETGPDSPLRMLAEIGISTNASGSTGSVDATRLRGYLEINESQLDDALARDFEAVGRLFGTDTDGDLVVDRGVAVALEQYLSPYVRTGGIVASRTDSLDTQIDQTEDRITRYNERLEDYEQELRNDFGRMEGMMEQLEESSRALDRLGGPSSQNGQ